MANINDFGFPFTSVAGDRQYSSQEWRDYFSKLIYNGLIQNDGNELEVKPQSVPNKTVFVETGTVLIDGVERILTATTTLTLADNTSGNPRIDRVVARLDAADRRIEFAVLQGTPAASPTAPALTRTTATYELGLADITLANGFSTIVAGNILDTRSDVTLCGAASMTIGVIPPSGLEAETVTLSTETVALYDGALNVDSALAELKKNLKILPLSLFDGSVNVSEAIAFLRLGSVFTKITPAASLLTISFTYNQYSGGNQGVVMLKKIRPVDYPDGAVARITARTNNIGGGVTFSGKLGFASPIVKSYSNTGGSFSDSNIASVAAVGVSANTYFDIDVPINPLGSLLINEATSELLLSLECNVPYYASATPLNYTVDVSAITILIP